MDYLPYIISMCLLVLASGYFSATETAFSSLNKTRLKTMIEKGNKRAELTLKLSEQYDKLISTILIGNNIVNIGLASIGTLLFISIYGNMGATISTIVVTIIVLIFGEISPKSIAKDIPEKFAMFSAPLLRCLMFILTPVNFVFANWKKLLAKLFRLQKNEEMSQEELLMLVDEVEQAGTIDSDEGELLRNAIEFTDMVAEDILTHRVDIEAISIDASREEIAKVFSDTQFSRLLVYDESIDNIVGVINLKDFYTKLSDDMSIKDILAEPIFVRKADKISDLLQNLQSNKTHMAVVIDEFGGTHGIVTMEDILEELVGEIWDEHDEVVEECEKLADDTYLIDCNMDLKNFYDRFAISSDSESPTLAAWIMEQLGKVPEENDEFQYENVLIKLVELDNHRVLKIECKIVETLEDSEDSSNED